MSKFDLFLIFIVIVLQNSCEVLSIKNETIEALEEVQVLKNDCQNLRILIDSEDEYYDFTNINKILEEFDINQANYELNEHIDEIREQFFFSPSYEAITKCITRAREASDEAVTENRNATSNCSSEPIFVANTNKANIRLIMKKVNPLQNDISRKYIECLMINDTTEILIERCLRGITILELNLTVINKEFYTQVPILRAKEEESLTDLRKCLVQIKDFKSISENIIETLTECIKKNSATNIYSKNILFFCLCLFCLLRVT